ncbi:MAG: polymer-forming cytoskeletal protein [Bacteroidales bacterium]|nr:polymer-forming cytoskeletal protein [Bacteroidales bacterium]
MFIRQKGSRAKAAEKSAETRADNRDTVGTPDSDGGHGPDARRPVPQNPTTVRTTAMIGVTVKIKGDISSDENLVVEGQVEGTITLNGHELTVGQSGRVSANVSAKTIRIEGQVNGDLVGKEKIIISKTGNVRGNLVAPTVILEEGGKFKGSIDMGGAVEPPVADFAAHRANSEGKAADATGAAKHG